MASVRRELRWQLQKKVGNSEWEPVPDKTAIITSENLNYSFTDLPKYENKTEIQYRVVETGDLNGYTQSGGTAGRQLQPD